LENLKIMSEPGSLTRNQVRLLWLVGTPVLIGTALLLLFFVAFPVLGIAKTFNIPSSGMAPTVQPGDRLYVRLKRDMTPERGTIVFFEPPDHPLSSSLRGMLLGRCVGVPGDTLEVVGEEVLINGEVIGLNPPRNPPGTNPRFAHSIRGQVSIPPDCYFVVGDNRSDSLDSRYYGYLESDLLRGAPLLRLWPLSRFGKIR
jgi:signal peptidase I